MYFILRFITIIYVWQTYDIKISKIKTPHLRCHRSAVQYGIVRLSLKVKFMENYIDKPAVDMVSFLLHRVDSVLVRRGVRVV